MISPAYVDGLEQHIEELKSELRSHKAAIAGLQAERDALSAHVERLSAWIKKHAWHADTCDILDLDDEGRHQDCSCGLDVINDKPPTTSLARLIAEKQAEALDDAAEAFEIEGRHIAAAQALRCSGAELRRQANGEPQ
jgi:phage shock protein A